jgi:hypothetical protein
MFHLSLRDGHLVKSWLSQIQSFVGPQQHEMGEELNGRLRCTMLLKGTRYRYLVQLMPMVSHDGWAV